MACLQAIRSINKEWTTGARYSEKILYFYVLTSAPLINLSFHFVFLFMKKRFIILLVIVVALFAQACAQRVCPAYNTYPPSAK